MGFWLQSRSALAFGAIWGVNERMETAKLWDALAGSGCDLLADPRRRSPRLGLIQAQELRPEPRGSALQVLLLLRVSAQGAQGTQGTQGTPGRTAE